MNRVILVAAAAAEMAAKVKEVVDAAAAAGVKTAVYKPCANGAEAAAELKEHRSAVLMEKIAADFLQKDFASVDTVVVEGAEGMNDVLAHKFNDDLATALDAKVYCNGEDADLFCPNRIMHCPKCLAKEFAAPAAERKTSQAMFRAGLLLKASKAKKRIVLPEGSEPRTVQAAKLVIDRKIAVPVLVGKKDEIFRQRDACHHDAQDGRSGWPRFRRYPFYRRHLTPGPAGYQVRSRRQVRKFRVLHVHAWQNLYLR